MRRLTLAGLFVLGLVALGPATMAYAHEERDSIAPDGSGSVPTYRTEGTTLLVCQTDQADFERRVADFPTELKTANQALWTQCQTTGYRYLQEAVNAVNQPNMIIKILPGVYLEEPSLAEPTGDCAHLSARKAELGYQVLSWEQQVACPHNQNLVAVLDKKNLQIEGTGAKPEDVIIDAQYQRLNAIRADRSSGIYLRNFTAQKTTFNAVYIMESDGFVIDKMVGRWNDEYGFLTFADDHGLYTDCEAYGNGDSGLYPGAASDINKDRQYDVDRYAIEIRNCRSHHNLLGYSGTAGDSVWAHDNTFTDNTVGVATDSAFPNHPGLPQNHALFENNVIGDNNQDYYGHVRDGTCQKPYPERGYEQGVVCPSVGVPPGTGVINPGGNYNVWRNNWVYGHSYAGFVTSWVPGFVRNDMEIAAQFDTSHHNSYYGNHLGEKPDGGSSPNGMDFWWDGQGVGSCWQSPSAGSEPRVLPTCNADHRPAGLGTARYVAEPDKVLKLYVCANYNLTTQRIPSDCDWFGATGLDRIEVKFALGEAVLLGLVLLVLWWRLLRGSGLAFIGLGLSLAGFVVCVYGTLRETTPLTPIGLGLFGLGWFAIGIALRRRGRPGLGFLTLAVGFFALLGAVDRGLYMLPWVPVPPSLWRLVLEVFWIPAAVIAILRGRMLAASTVDVPPPTGDALESYAARLRF
jgi:Right handed beta helix region